MGATDYYKIIHHLSLSSSNLSICYIYMDVICNIFFHIFHDKYLYNLIIEYFNYYHTNMTGIV